MVKVSKKVILVGLIGFLLYWGISIIKCEILTHRYGEQFSEIYRENTMIGEIDYFKILNYSDSEARVYYVSENRSGGDILIFEKEGDLWVYRSWERTVWSKFGSADGFMWPYIR